MHNTSGAVRLFLAVFGFFVCADGGALAQATQASPSFETVRQDSDLQVTGAGIYWLSNDVAYRALNTQGVEELRQFTLSFAPAYEALQVTGAYTLKKDGTKLMVRGSDILRGRGRSTAPGYDDTVTLTIVFPNVEVGDQIVLTTMRHQNVPWFAGVFATAFSFSRDYVVREATVALTTQGDDKQFFFDANSLDADPVQTGAGTTRRVWHFHNDVAEKPEPGAVMENDQLPHVAITTLGNYAAVAKLYTGAFAGKAAVTPEISALADTVTGGMNDRRAKAAALYAWVSGHIKYVDIVLGAGGFVPHTAAEVLKNGYGDCKDHVMLLQALLSAKGIDSSPVLIDAGSAQIHLPAAASPYLFNHLITYIPGLKLFVDSTAQFAPFGVLPQSDAGEPVLVVATGTLAKTPESTAADNDVRADSSLTVAADGSADGDTKVVAHGAEAVELRAGLSALPKNSEEPFFQALFGPGSTGQLDRGNPDELTADYTFNLHYHISSFVVLPGPGALPALPGYMPVSILGMVGSSLPQARQQNYFCPSGTLQQNATVTLPQTMTVTALPASQTLSVDGEELRSDFAQPSPNILRRSVTLRVDHPASICDAAYFAKVREGLFKMTNALRAQALYK